MQERGKGHGLQPNRAGLREWRCLVTARELPLSRAADRKLGGSWIVIGLPATLNLRQIFTAIIFEVARLTAGLIVETR